MTAEATNRTLEYAPPRVQSATRRTPLAVACLFVALVLGGLMCALLGSLIFDRGRGSPVAVGVSCAAIVASPLSCVAWALRRTASGRGLALVLVAVALVADVNLFSAVWHSGIDFVWVPRSQYDWLPVVGWAVLWTIWQALALAAMFAGRVSSR